MTLVIHFGVVFRLDIFEKFLVESRCGWKLCRFYTLRERFSDAEASSGTSK